MSNPHKCQHRRRPGHQLQVGILVEHRYLYQPQPTGLIQALVQRGHHPQVIDPQTTLYRLDDDRWLQNLDLVVVRGRSLGVLSLLAWLEQQGVPTFNRHAGVMAVHNKANMSMALATASIPTPPTFFGAPEKLRQAPVSSFPLILKPIFGDNGRGLYLVEDPKMVAQVSWPEPFLLAQQYLPNDGYDVKLYGIGDLAWAVRKPSPLHPSTEPPESLTLTQEMRDILARCRQLFGLDLLGVDCIQSDDGLSVIEVNEFPTYSGVPNASDHLVAWLEQQAARMHQERLIPRKVNQ
jgi:ribosomal protein S6--L-glutamate ligase